jgi:hypothetical protein
MFFTKFHNHQYFSSIETTNPPLVRVCDMVKNLVPNLSKSSQSAASNFRMSTKFVHMEIKEDGTIQGMFENMNMSNQVSHPTNMTMEI